MRLPVNTVIHTTLVGLESDRWLIVGPTRYRYLLCVLVFVFAASDAINAEWMNEKMNNSVKTICTITKHKLSCRRETYNVVFYVKKMLCFTVSHVKLQMKFSPPPSLLYLSTRNRTYIQYDTPQTAEPETRHISLRISKTAKIIN